MFSIKSTCTTISGGGSDGISDGRLPCLEEDAFLDDVFLAPLLLLLLAVVVGDDVGAVEEESFEKWPISCVRDPSKGILGITHTTCYIKTGPMSQQYKLADEEGKG